MIELHFSYFLRAELLDMAWKILGLIANSHDQDNQRYLQKACQEWAKSGAIRSPIILMFPHGA